MYVTVILSVRLRIEEGETIMRTLSDYWVVCRKSGHRRFFVVLNQKSANFAEITGEGEPCIPLYSVFEASLSMLVHPFCWWNLSNFGLDCISENGRSS